MKKIGELDDTMHNRTGQLDVFVELRERIQAVDSDRKVVELGLKTDLQSILTSFTEFNFKFEQNEKMFKQLVSNCSIDILFAIICNLLFCSYHTSSPILFPQTTNTIKATDDLSEMQDTVKDTNQKFMATLNEMNSSLLARQYELTQDNQRIHRRLND